MKDNKFEVGDIIKEKNNKITKAEVIQLQSNKKYMLLKVLEHDNKNNIGNEYSVHNNINAFELISTDKQNEEEIKKMLKVGDYVMIKKDLRIYGVYGGISYSTYMAKLKGKKLEINNVIELHDLDDSNIVSYAYRVKEDGGQYLWSKEMFDRLTEKCNITCRIYNAITGISHIYSTIDCCIKDLINKINEFVDNFNKEYNETIFTGKVNPSPEDYTIWYENVKRKHMLYTLICNLN